MFKAKQKFTSILVACLMMIVSLIMAVSTLVVSPQTASAAEGAWTLVTDVNNLAADDKVVIVAAETGSDGKYYALGTTQNKNNRGQAAVTKSGNTVTFGEAVQVLTLQAGKTSGTFAFNTGSGYLYAASSSSNYLRTETTLSANSSWAITIAADGTATVKAQGSYTRNTMQYNKSSSLFACYASASQKAICLYKFITATSGGGDSTCEHVNQAFVRIGDTYKHILTCTDCNNAIEGATEVECNGYGGFKPNQDKTHTATGTCTDCKGAVEKTENCTFGDDNICDVCAYVATVYTLNYNVPEGVTVEMTSQTEVEGTEITLPEPSVPDNYTFVGWAETEIVGSTEEKPTCFLGKYIVTANKTFYAVYSLFTATGGAAAYTKVTTAPADWSGDYLIVYEAGNVAFNGGLSKDVAPKMDADNNTVSVVISNGCIEATEAMKAAQFTITAVTGGYAIQSASGLYIGRTATSNGLNLSTSEKYVNTIALNGGNATIEGNGPKLQVYTSGANLRFRYYATTQQSICLYKLSESGTTSYMTSFAECAHENTNLDANENRTHNVVCNDCQDIIAENVDCSCENFNAYEKIDGVYQHNATGECDCGNEVVETQDCMFVDFVCEDCEYELPTYTVTYYVKDEVVETIKAHETEKITLKECTQTFGDYTFAGWTTVADTTSSEGANAAGFTYEVTGDISFYALYMKGGYQLVTDVNQITVGSSIVIAAVESDYALSTTQNPNNRGQADIVKNANVITFGNDVQVLTVEAGTIDGTFAFNTGSGYLYAASSSSNYLRTEEKLSNNSSWAITIDEGVMSIVAQGTNTRNNLRYNNTNKIFSCYDGASQKAVCIYKLASDTVYTTNPEICAVISSASLSLGADLTMNYYVRLSEGYEDATMTFTFGDKTVEGVVGDVQNDDRYKFAFTGIVPQAMTVEITAKVMYNGVELVKHTGYSVQKYAMNVFAKESTSDVDKKVLVNMLVYGAEAQEYKNYNTDNLATSQLTEEQLTAWKAADVPTTTDFSLTDAQNPVWFSAAGVYFDNTNKLYVKLEGSLEGVTLKINGVEVAAEDLSATVYTDGIKMTDFNKTYQFDLYVEGMVDPIQTLVYSVNAYAYEKQAHDEIGELALALYRLGVAAKDYNA